MHEIDQDRSPLGRTGGPDKFPNSPVSVILVTTLNNRSKHDTSPEMSDLKPLRNFQVFP